MKRHVARMQRACSDERGTVAIIAALCLTIVFGCTALAVDIGRTFTAARALENSLDAATLAGAKLLNDANATDSDVANRVLALFQAQSPILGIPTADIAAPAITIDRQSYSVTATGTMQIPTLFAGVLNSDFANISKTVTVTYNMRDLELALVLDVTGSMAEVPTGDIYSKIASLKNSATTVVDLLYNQASAEASVRIALVPFSASVNAGALAPIVVSAGSGASTTCAVERLGADNATDAAPTGTNKLRSLTSVGGANFNCLTPKTLPLTGKSSLTLVKETIASLSPGGTTAGHIGAAWGMYTLSPNWASIFAAAQQPKPYNDKTVTKNFVLMTDGLFNTSYLTGASTNSGTAINESYNQLDAICANMKTNGINVYTIGFGLTDPTASAELKKCASSEKNFFAVATGADLQTAFGAIFDNLTALRLAK